MERLVWSLSVLFSFVLHLGTIVVLPAEQVSQTQQTKQEVTFEVIEAAAEEPKEGAPDGSEAATAEPTDPPTPIPDEPAPAKPATPARASAEAAPAPAQEAIADFTGETLSSESSESWSSAAGDETASTKPNGSPGKTTGRTKRGVLGGQEDSSGSGPPRPVPLGSLSRKPAPPNLDQKLERHYPAWAKRQEVEGTALVSARIEADGTVSSIRVKRETERGFGSACRRTLSGSRWSPPRDRTGRVVATVVEYRCRFEMRF